MIWRHREPRDGTYGSIDKIAEDGRLTPGAAELAEASVRLADFA